MAHRLRFMRWRIASAYIVLIVSTLALLALVFVQLLRTTYLRTLEAGLAGQARLVAAINNDPAATVASPTLATTVNQLHDQLDARVTLIAADGTVLADSFQSPAANGNLLDRPEVRDALALGQGANERNSVATGDEMFYVAVPFGPRDAPTGVARVGVPLTMIAQAQTRLVLTVLATALLAAAITLALAVLIARRTTRPLLELRSMAARLAGGDLEVQVPIPPDEEVAALAQDFNLMASRLRQLLAAIDTERQRLSTVLATMADGILLLGSNATVTLINHAATQLVGISSDALPVELAALPIDSSLLSVVQALDRRPSDDQSIVVNEVVVPTTQRSLRAVVTRVPTPAQGQTLIVLQDLTDLRRAEQARRAFLANISHDLRTPIASLQAMIETLQDGALDDRAAAEDFLRRMDDEVQGLNRLVREFLELTRIESGQLELAPSPTDLWSLLAAAAARMAAQSQQRGDTIDLALPMRLPVLNIDGARIEQVLLNLLQNALSFTPRGGRITLGAELRGDQVAIWVRDTGTGISPDDLPHIFERFYKADHARTGGGTGLGLAIAKHLVERHGGQIGAISQPGHGTTVTFSLPLAGPYDTELKTA
jgi:two-component system, OmpR family, phosphate regulon sensor histidine kinase PhoR